MAVRDPATNAFYRTVWRWHFYAGLFVMPFILVLSLTGAVFLFKPQLDRWQERSFQNLPGAGAATPSAQRNAALAAFPGSRFDSYRLPAETGDAPVVHIGLASGTMRDVYVSPQGKVLGSIDPETRISALASRIHGTLLAGKTGSWIVETAGSWAIVMVLTGLYLWWPRGRGAAGVVWPRWQRGALWRDLHAVTGFWVSGLALVLLVTALPWAGVWGEGFKLARAELGWVKGKQDWKTGGEHAEHDHAAMLRVMAAPNAPGLDAIVAKAATENLPAPVLVKPPAETMVWTVKSDTQNRPQRVTITYDAATGNELSRSGQADKHIIDRAVAYGIAWHEGALFGWANQLIGLLTALMLVGLAASSFVLWRRRKPDGVLGAPPLPKTPARIGGVVAIVLILAAMLPMLALSLVVILLVELLVLRRIPVLARWLGLRATTS
ncbi:PepSY domain-containing protein [Sphingomonas sp. SUN039]|uniref:PepSY-associated TM helix domain-containing protein n=1 Tax=Sphingomonas sp. SUN039 TaxID=2937787 RepID=UPI002164BC1F|nr:PepSY domain-containing protein [Sphingomonas sp. SUN039]UVO55557.1 PepSY domain-containing protein [Sphingomonas sp. SUN039]